MREFLGSFLGLAALAAVAQAQFAQQRPTGPVPIHTGSSIIPAATSQATQPLPTAHPWYVKPEYGQWMICVKSYSGENARLNAEALAADIRERYRVPAYLFERGAAERRQEQERHARELARQRAERAAEEQAFNAVLAQAQAEAKARGMEFLASKPEIKAATVRYEEQYAVLIGGWPTMDTARREMEKVRRWDPPTNKALMDRQFIVSPKGGEMALINPFQSGMVVPNPAAPRAVDTEGANDMKFLIKMNADEEYSLLRIQKNWTIAAKQFTPPLQVKDKEEKSFIARMLSDKPDAMAAAGEQARSLAKSLRSMKPTPKFPYGPYDAYVLHTKYGSLVCVGQFDGPDDPKMLEIQNQLGHMEFNVSDPSKPGSGDRHGVRLFDRLYAMKVR